MYGRFRYSVDGLRLDPPQCHPPNASLGSLEPTAYARRPPQNSPKSRQLALAHPMVTLDAPRNLFPSILTLHLTASRRHSATPTHAQSMPPANAHLHTARTELRHDMARLGGFCAKKHMRRASCCLAAGGQRARPVSVWVLTANEAWFYSVPFLCRLSGAAGSCRAQWDAPWMRQRAGPING